ncbi:VOC family protein [Streptomyces sp. SID13031]|uniref:VOC family protein n=1 Tax=Streptomyces sp. SID13031 TaxID=2706046 RepID=UPI0013C598EB|nr:VOC family protein [Streptomyces sp. SID13031]NEA37120.1 VOC family protein [Streptomyces sp. SID13031]
MKDVVVRPLRFTDDVQAMRAFLETLGLRSRIESESGVWVDMVAGRGMVALHDAAGSTSGAEPGETRLAFEADDIDVLKDRLNAAGYEDVSIFDEAFGRVLTASGPDGTELWIDERSKDLYGYKLHDAHPDARWSVTPLLGVSDQAAWEQLLGILGGDNPDLVGFRPAGEFEVQVELTTTESLGEVARRLAATGYRPDQVEGGLSVVDPDGQTVRVRG